jgi:hypothetical protein
MRLRTDDDTLLGDACDVGEDSGLLLLLLLLLRAIMVGRGKTTSKTDSKTDSVFRWYTLLFAEM